MDPKDRDKIRDNLDELVRVTEWNATLENCVIRNGNLKKIINTLRVSHRAFNWVAQVETDFKKYCILSLNIACMSLKHTTVSAA